LLRAFGLPRTRGELVRGFGAARVAVEDSRAGAEAAERILLEEEFTEAADSGDRGAGGEIASPESDRRSRGFGVCGMQLAAPAFLQGPQQGLRNQSS